MFWAAEKTEEKKPPPGEPWEPGVRTSSCMGVNGADIALDNLLGACVAESDRTRRCDIMFPEEEVTVLELIPADPVF